MPNIEDLKNDGNNKKPFIPSLDQGATTTNEPFVPTIEGGETPEPPRKKGSIKGSAISMTSGKVANRENRVKADLSSLPNPDAEDKKITYAESKTNEILGPGGPFEKYVNTMAAEAAEFFANEELEKEVEENNNSDKENPQEKPAEKTEEELENEEIEKQYESTPVNNKYKTVDIFDEDLDDEDEDVEDDIKEILEDDEIDEEEEGIVDPLDFDVDEEVVTPAIKKEESTTVEEDDEPEDPIEITREIIKTDISEVEDDSEDIFAEEEKDNDDDDVDDGTIDILRAMVSERMRPVSKKMDISGFTVAKKPSMSNNIIAPKEVPVAKWALPSTGIVIHMKEILGSNLEKIRSFVQSNDSRGAFQIIYDNIVSPKPESLDAWLKSIAFEDYNHIFFAIYIASFADSNFIPIDCPNKDCSKKHFITENLPMMELVKFKDANAEKKFKQLLKSDVTNGKGLVPTEIVPISDRFAFGFVLPSLYSVLVEASYLDRDFTNKYANAVTITPYIDQIYYIDKENSQLVPIGYKDYPNNKVKTIKSRIVKYDKVISTLEADEIALIRAYISKIVTDASADVSYQMPAVTCPFCGKEIPAQEVEASSLVFTRNQLGLLMNI